MERYIIVDTREPMDEFKKEFLNIIDNSKEGDIFPEIKF